MNNGKYDKMISVIDMEMPNRKPNRIAGYDYSQSGAYFITICTQDRKKILSKISVGTPLPGCPQEPCVELLWHGEVADKYIRQMDAFYEHLSVDQYVIMPDHIHMLLWINEMPSIGGQGSGRPTLMNIIHAFKQLTTKAAAIDLWQTSFYEHVVRNETDLREIRTYIQNNPTAWELLP